MKASEYIIPCVCGVEVRTHEPATVCKTCGRHLVVEKPDKEGHFAK